MGAPSEMGLVAGVKFDGMGATMKVSLIVSTLDRPTELQEFLESAINQTLPVDQVVVIDQSDDDCTQRVVESFGAQLPIKYARQRTRGLSRGRNEGLRHATGDIIGFPDDDCLYPSNTIERVVLAFRSNPGLGIYTGMSISKAGVPSQGRWGRVSHRIDLFNLWISQTSYTTFYRASTLMLLRRFDETLGVGSGTRWGAGEESELMVRALKSGAEGRYDPDLRIIHPEPLAIYDDSALERGRKYNRGFGRVLSLGNYPIWFVVYMFLRPLVGAAFALVSGHMRKAQYRAIASFHRFRGWCDREL